MRAGAGEPASESDLERPLEGARVLVLRPEGQAEELAELLRAEGAEPVAIPAVRIVARDDPYRLDSVIDRLAAFDWVVFSSVNGAELFLHRLEKTGRSVPAGSGRIAAIGPATRTRLENRGVAVHWLPSAYTTRAVGDELPMRPGPSTGSSPGSRPTVCLIRADIASPELDERLQERGFDVERVDVYTTEPINTELIREAVHSVDSVALTSASIVQSFASAAGTVPSDVRIVSIGPATSQACRAHGLRVDSEAKEHTVQGLLEALKEV